VSASAIEVTDLRLCLNKECDGQLPRGAQPWKAEYRDPAAAPSGSPVPIPGLGSARTLELDDRLMASQKTADMTLVCNKNAIEETKPQELYFNFRAFVEGIGPVVDRQRCEVETECIGTYKDPPEEVPEEEEPVEVPALPLKCRSRDRLKYTNHHGALTYKNETFVVLEDFFQQGKGKIDLANITIEVVRIINVGEYSSFIVNDTSSFETDGTITIGVRFPVGDECPTEPVNHTVQFDFETFVEGLGKMEGQRKCKIELECSPDPLGIQCPNISLDAYSGAEWGSSTTVHARDIITKYYPSEFTIANGSRWEPPELWGRKFSIDKSKLESEQALDASLVCEMGVSGPDSGSLKFKMVVDVEGLGEVEAEHNDCEIETNCTSGLLGLECPSMQVHAYTGHTPSWYPSFYSAVDPPPPGLYVRQIIMEDDDELLKTKAAIDTLNIDSEMEIDQIGKYILKLLDSSWTELETEGAKNRFNRKNITFFAPTNRAWEDLGNGTYERMLENATNITMTKKNENTTNTTPLNPFIPIFLAHIVVSEPVNDTEPGDNTDLGDDTPSPSPSPSPNPSSNPSSNPSTQGPPGTRRLSPYETLMLISAREARRLSGYDAHDFGNITEAADDDDNCLTGHTLLNLIGDPLNNTIYTKVCAGIRTTATPTGNETETNNMTYVEVKYNEKKKGAEGEAPEVKYTDFDLGQAVITKHDLCADALLSVCENGHLLLVDRVWVPPLDELEEYRALMPGWQDETTESAAMSKGNSPFILTLITALGAAAYVVS